MGIEISTAAHTGTRRPAASVEMQVLDNNGNPVGEPITTTDVSLNATAHLSDRVANPRLWTAETPNLYQCRVEM